MSVRGAIRYALPAPERLAALDTEAMRGFARTDSLPAADVAVQRAAAAAYGARYADAEGLRRLADRWRGWESYATSYLWRTLSKPAG